MGFAERLDLATLKPEPLALTDPDPEGGNTYMEGTNAIGATVADGLVWITDESLNYCGDPRNARKLAAIPLPQPDVDSVLAIGTRYIYYAAASGLGVHQYLGRIPVPARCSYLLWHCTVCRARSGTGHWGIPVLVLQVERR